ncbi:ATPase, T2SS/T4P/T4SS family [Azospirillum canadense]|uniref:ATPase, T2SS/T4P/T4SS family n=1 Tax=Azospirillum canadense TaxID=403962 RepID=UPI002227415A|nr:ATPase, T2SS/T4P/T4SS family [Azospirillum canadense]MCW2240349.1 defect-in-organelle-trafficking protein DotB [Azospirillum canadense]
MNTAPLRPTWPALPAAPDASGVTATVPTTPPQDDHHPSAPPAGQGPAPRGPDAPTLAPDLLPRRPAAVPRSAAPAPPSLPGIAPAPSGAVSLIPPRVSAGLIPPFPLHTPPSALPVAPAIAAPGATGRDPFDLSFGALYLDAPAQWTSVEEFNTFLKWCHANSISDVTLGTGKKIICKRHGAYRGSIEHDLTSADVDNIFSFVKSGASLSPGDTFRGVYKLFLDQEIRERLRTRVTIHHITGSTPGKSVVLRLIDGVPPTPEKARLTPDLLDAFEFKYGLGLVCGKMDSGKTWTFAAVNSHRLSNPRYDRKIMHFGQPIEFLFDSLPAKDNIYQIEIPECVRDYPTALKMAKSATPDIIVMEEVNDRETMSMTIDAAQSGVAVNATLHISRVAAFPGAMLTYYPDAHERESRAYAAMDEMQVIMVQRLEPMYDAGNPDRTIGRVALREYLVFDEQLRTQVKREPLTAWPQVLNKLVEQHGCTMLHSARALHAEGLLTADQVSRIERGKA